LLGKKQIHYGFQLLSVQNSLRKPQKNRTEKRNPYKHLNGLLSYEMHYL